MQLVHVAPHARGFGGIETLLARHAAHDAGHGIDAWQVGLFEKNARIQNNYTAMHFGWRSTPRAMRRALAGELAKRGERVVVWHNAWALPWFADVDTSRRRIMVMHADPSYYRGWLPRLAGWLDGVLAVSPGGVVAARETFQELSGERVRYLPLPIDPPVLATETRVVDGVVRIGCAGRLARPQKRWDRLVPFVAELRRLGVDFRLEVIGRGPLEQWLRRELAGEPRVEFLGFLEKADYWRRMARWDLSLFFSDVEGGPLVLLEAMAMGVVPIYPAIGGSMGDEYAPQIDERCHYRAGDVAAAVQAVRAMAGLTPERWRDLRERARALAAKHVGMSYEASFAEFVREIAAAPRISRAPTGGRVARWTDRLPLGLVTRAFPGALWR